MPARSRYEQTVGPAAEADKDAWCVDCGHYQGLHKEKECLYWTGLCKCEGFVSRSEALNAVKILKESGHSDGQK